MMVNVARPPAVSFALLAVFGSAVSFSFATVLAGVAFGRHDITVETVILGRFAVGALLLWLLTFLFQVPFHLTAKRASLLIGQGVLPSTQALLFYQSVSLVPASVATLVLYTYPAIVTFLSIAHRREGVDGGKVLALGLSALGLILVLGVPSEPLSTIGIVFGLMSALTLAWWIVIANATAKDESPLLSSALVLSGGAVFLALVSLLTRRGSLDADGWSWAIPIGVVTSLAILLLIVALRHISPTTVAIGSTVEPLSTGLLSAWVLGEKLGLAQVLGGLLIGVGVVVAVRARSDRGKDSFPGSGKSQSLTARATVRSDSAGGAQGDERTEADRCPNLRLSGRISGGRKRKRR